MTRLKDPSSDQRFDLESAFKYLGKAPTHRDLAQAIDYLRRSGAEDVVYDRKLREAATQNGSSALVALDLHSAFYFGVEALHAGPQRKPEAVEK